MTGAASEHSKPRLARIIENAVLLMLAVPPFMILGWQMPRWAQGLDPAFMHPNFLARSAYPSMLRLARPSAKSPLAASWRWTSRRFRASGGRFPRRAGARGVETGDCAAPTREAGFLGHGESPLAGWRGFLSGALGSERSGSLGVRLRIALRSPGAQHDGSAHVVDNDLAGQLCPDCGDAAPAKPSEAMHVLEAEHE